MSTFSKDNNLFVETLISIFTLDEGDIKVLLIKNKQEPYNGYWILPGSPLKNNESLEDNITDTVLDQTGLKKTSIEQCYAFSNVSRYPDQRVLAISYLGIVDSISVKLNQVQIDDIEYDWFPMKNLPKMAYDHEDIVNKNIEFLRKKITSIANLKELFPSDFTLPEIQSVYEQISGKELDRRNFRKKILSSDLIEETDYYTSGSHGRPAKLYKFKEDVKVDELF